MSRKEKYFTQENFQDEVDGILKMIRLSGIRNRSFEVSGRPALLVTDMQEYFLSPSSHAFIPSTEAILPKIIHLIKYFERLNYPVLFTQHINDAKNAGKMKTWWKDLITKDSPFAQITSALKITQSPNPPISQSPFLPFSEKTIIEKTQYDAFYQTDLENKLLENGIDTLIICGVMTNLCCETTLRSAFVRGFNAIIPVDATATYRREYHIGTFINLSFGFCPVKTTVEIIERLKS